MLKAIPAELRPEPVREPLPPPKVYAPPRATALEEGNNTMTKCCFVVSPIGPRASDIRVAADNFMKYIVNPCVEGLGLEFEKPIRADQLPEPGRITSQVVELLKSADLVIADLTGYNANVYYELSFRHAIGRPTVHMAVEGTDSLLT
jgi:hypothetical protein